MTTYTLSTRAFSAQEVYASFETDDLTDSTTVVTVTTTGTTIVLPQYTTDNGTTWKDHSAGTYNVNTATSVRSITIPSGKMRLVLANDQATASTVSATVVASTITSGTITPEDVYRTGGINEAKVPRGDVLNYILRSEGIIKEYVGRPLTTDTLTEEYRGNNKRSLFLDYTPVVSLTSLSIGGTDITTTYVDLNKVTGEMTLESTAETTRFTLPGVAQPNTEPAQYPRNIDVVYVWGSTTAPQWILRMTEIMAAIMMLTQQTGGTFDDITSYGIGDYTASLGEPWTNINRTVQNLQKEFDTLLRNQKKAIAVF